MKIIYKTPEGGLAIIIPSPSWANSMERLAKKEVPKGLKYKIVEDSVIPSDYTFRDAWEVNESDLTDGEGEHKDGVREEKSE